ncbi:hypothetical protein HMPREF1573_00097 [Gardnerella vaginalis JCP7276]|nr:hypothetical protein HMPREF1573_00097 [Gardnerella vaginalis JCP7276]
MARHFLYLIKGGALIVCLIGYRLIRRILFFKCLTNLGKEILWKGL